MAQQDIFTYHSSNEILLLVVNMDIENSLFSDALNLFKNLLSDINLQNKKKLNYRMMNYYH